MSESDKGSELLLHTISTRPIFHSFSEKLAWVEATLTAEKAKDLFSCLRFVTDIKTIMY